MPEMSELTSLATSTIDTFITDESSAITNWPAASVASTSELPDRAPAPAVCEVMNRTVSAVEHFHGSSMDH